MDYSPPGSSVHGDSPGKNTGKDCHELLQGIFPAQRSNLGLPHCRWIFYCLSHQGSPRILEWVADPFSRGTSHPRNLIGVSSIAGRFFTNWATRQAPFYLRYEWFRESFLAIHIISILFLYSIYSLVFKMECLCTLVKQECINSLIQQLLSDNHVPDTVLRTGNTKCSTLRTLNQEGESVRYRKCCE